MEKVAKEIVESILDDLTGRSGLEDVWYSIDEEIQNEIKASWKSIVLDILRSQY